VCVCSCVCARAQSLVGTKKSTKKIDKTFLKFHLRVNQKKT
jgi:hypothetical protein